MPYIKQDKRDEIEPALQALLKLQPSTSPGWVRHLCDQIVLHYVKSVAVFFNLTESKDSIMQPLTKLLQGPGDYNYVLTRILQQYILEQGERYTHYNHVVGILEMLKNSLHSLRDSMLYGGDIVDIVGMIECCKLEFYRRMVASYEDQKIAENGDVTFK